MCAGGCAQGCVCAGRCIQREAMRVCVWGGGSMRAEVPQEPEADNSLFLSNITFH